MSVIKLLEDTGYLEKLSSNHQGDYIFKFDINDELGISIKYMVEQPSKIWTFGSKFDKIHILEFEDENEYIIISKDEILKRQVRTYNFKEDYESKFIKIDQIISELHKYENFSQTPDDIKLMLKRIKLSREDNVEIHGGAHRLEANSIKEFYDILNNKNILKTNECCLADMAYYKDDVEKTIAIQVKTASISKNRYYFHQCHKYDGMLLFCRPNPKIKEGTVIIPGGFVKNPELCVGFNEKKPTKYQRYFVKDDELAEFMLTIYDAIESKQKTLVWPSGLNVDIESLKYYEYNDLCIPLTKDYLKEYEYGKWRKEILPDLIYEQPDVEKTTVDIIINGIRVQDKSAKFYRNGWQCGLKKTVD